MTDKRADITPAALAYLGDSVIEVLARERLVSAGIPDSARLNLAAAKYVRATVQSDAVERILPLLDEAEAAVYRRATGMEALFGWLWLGGEEGKTRARELFCAAYGNEN